MKRRWADVKDIGFREIAANQQDDIKKGQDALEELKRSGRQEGPGLRQYPSAADSPLL
jgi:hypothetical protein